MQALCLAPPCTPNLSPRTAGRAPLGQLVRARGQALRLATALALAARAQPGGLGLALCSLALQLAHARLQRRRLRALRLNFRLATRLQPGGMEVATPPLLSPRAQPLPLPPYHRLQPSSGLLCRWLLDHVLICQTPAWTALYARFEH